MRKRGDQRGAGPRRGYSIFEVMVVLTLMSILLSIAAPSFQTAIERSKADIAVANLRAVWSAERFYYVLNPTQTDPPAFTLDLSQLQTLGLIEPEVGNATAPYTYTISPAADGGVGFVATATRTGSGTFTGSFSIDQNGVTSGSVTDGGSTTIQPSNQ